MGLLSIAAQFEVSHVVAFPAIEYSTVRPIPTAVARASSTAEDYSSMPVLFV
jgi:hypothetical protein